MVHVRIVVPSGRAEKVLDLLEATPSTCNLVYLEGAARQPAGDVVLCAESRVLAGLPADSPRVGAG